jgi:branched-chain amino acid aminotransferase
LAAVYKKESGFDESIILNTKGNIADTIYANLFLIKNEKIYTPALSEAPVDGVMRKQVLQLAKKQGYKIYEEAITGNDLTNADEIFLTNAIKGIQWVGQFKNKFYTNANGSLNFSFSLLSPNFSGFHWDILPHYFMHPQYKLIIEDNFCLM